MVRLEKQHHNRSRGWRPLSEQEVGRPHFRFHNPYQEGELEFLIQAEYDYGEYALDTATVALTLFSIQKGGSYTPTGGSAFFKNTYHTNLKQAGVLAAPKKHLTKGITISVRNDANPTDMILFTYNTQCKFIVGDGDKSYFDGLVHECPASGGVYGGFSGTDSTNIASAYNNGYPQASNMLMLAIDDNDGVGIEQGQTLNFVLDPTQVQAGAFTTATSGVIPIGTGLKFHVRLQGIEARGVQ
jgi:hypothetical protein